MVKSQQQRWDVGVGRHGLSLPRGQAERRLVAGGLRTCLAWALIRHIISAVYMQTDEKAGLALLVIHLRSFNFSCHDCVTVLQVRHTTLPRYLEGVLVR